MYSVFAHIRYKMRTNESDAYSRRVAPRNVDREFYPEKLFEATSNDEAKQKAREWLDGKIADIKSGPNVFEESICVVSQYLFEGERISF